jgi:hypothetical protein
LKKKKGVLKILIGVCRDFFCSLRKFTNDVYVIFLQGREKIDSLILRKTYAIPEVIL